MHRFIKLPAVSLMVLGSMVTAGCASTQAASHANTSDPSWTPPGQVDLAINECEQKSIQKTAEAEAMPQPNRRVVLKRQLHAATY